MARLLCALLWVAAAVLRPSASAAQETTPEPPTPPEERPSTARVHDSALDSRAEWQLFATPRPTLETMRRWREFLDGYAPLESRLHWVAGYYLANGVGPTRVLTPEFQATLTEEAAARAAIRRLAMPLLPGRDEAQRDIDQIFAALDGLRTLASSPALPGSTSPTERARAQRAVNEYGEFLAAATSTLARLRALSEGR